MTGMRRAPGIRRRRVRGKDNPDRTNPVPLDTTDLEVMWGGGQEEECIDKTENETEEEADAG